MNTGTKQNPSLLKVFFSKIMLLFKTPCCPSKEEYDREDEYFKNDFYRNTHIQPGTPTNFSTNASNASATKVFPVNIINTDIINSDDDDKNSISSEHFSSTNPTYSDDSFVNITNSSMS